MIETKIILASASPRRKEILERAGLEFEIIKSDCEEITTKSIPQDIVCELSKLKAFDVASKVKDDAMIIASDTIVVYEKKIMGKPKDNDDAFSMLNALAGNTHQVYTGVTVCNCNKKIYVSFAQKTDVTVYPMTRQQILNYINTGESSDKAGAYAIQGKFAIFIKRINGSYDNVVGMPVSKLFSELYKQGIDIYPVL